MSQPEGRAQQDHDLQTQAGFGTVYLGHRTGRLEYSGARRLGPKQGLAPERRRTVSLALGLRRNLFSTQPAQPDCGWAPDHFESGLCYDARRNRRPQRTVMGRSNASWFGARQRSSHRGRWRGLDLEPCGRPICRSPSAGGLPPCQPTTQWAAAHAMHPDDAEAAAKAHGRTPMLDILKADASCEVITDLEQLRERLEGSVRAQVDKGVSTICKPIVIDWTTKRPANAANRWAAERWNQPADNTKPAAIRN